MLSAFETVNLFNGNLQFALPLHEVRGRGDARHTMVLSIGNRWQLTTFSTPNGTAHIVGGGQGEPFWKYGPGIVTGVKEGTGQPCGSLLTQLVFRDAEGTEHELRDVLTEGEPKCPPTPTESFNRGREFRTFDGSATTFVSDTDLKDNITDDVTHELVTKFTPSGLLLFRDGHRYRVDNGLITSLQDRNGNRLEFVYESSPPPTDFLDPPLLPDVPPPPVPWYRRLASVRDSLGRMVTITYATAETPHDTITFSGAGGVERRVQVHRGHMSSALFPGESIATQSELFPELNLADFGSQIHNPGVVTAVTLPDGRDYRFQYNRYGELMKVELPTGGSIQYTHGAGKQGGPPSGVDGLAIHRRVHSRTVHDGVGGAPQTTLFGQENPGGPQLIIDETRMDGSAVVRRDRHYFTRVEGSRPSDRVPLWRVGREERTEVFDGDGVFRRRIVHEWAQRENLSWCQDPLRCPINDPRVIRTDTVLDSGQASRQDFEYDRYNNLTRIREYDFKFGESDPWFPILLLRETRRAYLTANERGVYEGYPVHVRNAVREETVFGPGGSLVSKTCYGYDEGALVDRPGILGHDPERGPDFIRRGNVTTVRRARVGDVCDLTTVHNLYDVAGNVVESSDAKGNRTQFSYDDRFGAPDGEADSNAGGPSGPTFAFATQVRNPLGHTVTTQYDYDTGQTVDAADVNGVVTSTRYTDALDRLTDVIVAANTSQPSRTRFEYDDAQRTITTARDLDTSDDGKLRTQTVYDGLGRTVLIRRFEDTSEILTETRYDALGRVRQVTNPYRPGDAIEATTTEYDLFDRVTKVTQPDGAETRTSYVGNVTLVTDPAGRQRQSVRDSLGRVVRVTEDPGGTALETSYQYDAADNITRVGQGEQVRTFQYDALSRLRSAANPESGTTTYEYDDNGNLTKRTDARGVVTNASHDALDRIEQQTYSDGTPAVTYAYDTAPGGTGDLASVSSTVSTSRFIAYDPFGNVTQYSQQTGSKTYSMSYTYNLAEVVTSSGYPSGRRIDTTYDAAGRISGVRGTFQGRPTDFIRPGSLTYAPHGLISGMDLGNGVQSRTFFNTRLQADRVRVGPEHQPLFLADYGYGGANNNGNVLSQTVVAGPVSVQQSYTYDRLNRLARASESGAAWTQVYGYDRFGNRWVEPGSYMPNAAQTPQTFEQFDPSTNRVRIPGALYDPAGNLTQDWLGRTFDYDAENRQVRFVSLGDTVTYAYDGAGRRVTKTGGGITVTFVYDAFGRLVAELAPGKSREYVYAGHRLLAAVKFAEAPAPPPPPPDNTSPVGALDSARNQSDGTATILQDGTLFAAGWAADNEDGSPVARVRIDIDGRTVGDATLGDSRPDVADGQGRPAYLRSGYHFTGSIGREIPGTHTVRATAYDSAGAATVLGGARQITVVADSVVVEMSPADGLIEAGGSVHLFVRVSYPATFQWFQGSAYASSLPVTGATSAAIDVSPASDTGYWVRVTEPTGVQHDSAIVFVRVGCGAPPLVVILSQPLIPIVARPDTVFLTAVGTVEGLAYTWYTGESGDTSHFRGNGATIGVIAVDPVQKFWVRARDACGRQVDSRTAAVYACLPRITSQPAADRPVLPADGSLTARLHVEAVSSNTVAPHYQWYREAPPGVLPIAIPGSDSPDLAVTAAQAGTYWVDVIGTCSETLQGRTTSDRVTVGTCTPPVLTTGALPSQVERNAPVTLSVQAGGDTLTFQWYRGTSGDLSSPIEGATDGYYSFPATADASYWALVKSRGVCQSASETMRVAVCDKPVVSTPVAAATDVMPGGSTTLSVSATGASLSYQWKQSVGGAAYQQVGTNAPLFTTGPLSQDTSFLVDVSSGICKRPSSPVTVRVCSVSAHWTTSGLMPLHSGDLVMIGFSGSPAPGNGTVAYWYRGRGGDLAGSTLISGPTSATVLPVSPTETTSYWVRLKSTAPGSPCQADTGTLTLNVCLPRIVQPPASTIVDPGGSATLRVTTDVSPATYQWYVGGTSETGSPLPGATGPVLTIAPSATTSYWVRVTGGCSAIADSEPAIVTVAQPAVITTQPADASITTSGVATLSVIATGTDLVYQWYQGTAGNTTTPVGGSSATLFVSPPRPTDYWVRVSGARGVVDSRTAHVSVCAPPVITAQPSDRTIFSGGAAGLSVTATESTGEPRHYQWFRGPGTGSPVGADSASYDTGTLTATTQYRVRVSAGICLTNSTTATVSMCALPQTTGAAANQQIALGDTGHLTAPVSALTGRSFRWFRGTSGDTSAPVGGWVVGNMVDVAPSVTTTYWYQVQDSAGCLSSGGTTTVSVCIPHITQEPAGTTITSGSSTALSVVSDLPAATYQWYTGASGNTAFPIPGATAASRTVAPTATTDYWVRVSGPCGQPVDSATATVTVAQPTAIVTQPADASVAVPGAAAFTVVATGTDVVYQWYLGMTGNTSTPVGADSPTLVITPATPTDYWVRVAGASGVVNSRTAHVSVCTTPTITTPPQGSTIFSGTAATLTAAAHESTGEPVHYQWYAGSTPVGSDSATYTTPPLMAQTNYRVGVTAGICGATSQTVTVSLCILPQTVGAAPNQNAAAGGMAHLVAPGPAGPGFSFRWFKGASGDTSLPQTGWQASQSYDAWPYATTQYWYQVKNGSCISNSGTTTVSVCIPTITQQPTDVQQSPTTLTVTAAPAGVTYQWYVGSSGEVGAPIPGAAGPSLAVAPSYTTSYWVRVTGTCGSVDSDTATVSF